MSPGSALSARFALDVQGVDALKYQARESSPETVKAAAQQFEAVFMNMLLKSMRATMAQDGLFDSEQTRLYTSMLDQQLAQSMASRGIGLADLMVRQLTLAQTAQAVAPETGTVPVPLEAARAYALESPQGLQLETPATGVPGAPPVDGRRVPDPGVSPASAHVPAHVADFARRLLPAAEEASRLTGIPAAFMVGQAALETGWGRQAIRHPDGRDSHNLFGIKAGMGWRGATVDVVTTEYVAGRPVRQVETFRAYDSPQEAFADYARLLTRNARYRQVIAEAQDASAFARNLQQAGYATDPAYARKLAGTIDLVGRAQS